MSSQIHNKPNNKVSSQIHDKLNNEEGTVLLFYPQDIMVTSDPTTLLAKIEQCRIPQQINDGPEDKEMFTIEQGGKVKISQINTLQPFTAEFDKLHTFTAAKLTANMWRDTLEALRKTFPQDQKLVNAVEYWDTMPHGRLQISPYGLKEEKNAYYQRGWNGCELVFGYFTDQKGDMIYTCRSPDIVAHETGHYALDRLRPSFNESTKSQTGGLHEAFGDISALSFVFADDAMARALINSTGGNLHASNNFAARLAEEFGISLGMHGFLRSADDDYTLSEVTGEVYYISGVFTGAYYDALASAFNEAIVKFREYNPVNLLQAVSEYARNIFLHAIVSVESKSPEFVDIAIQLDKVIDQHSQKAPSRVDYLKTLNWKTYFQNEFKRREVSKPSNEIHYAPKQRITSEQKKPEPEYLASVCGGVHKLEK